VTLIVTGVIPSTTIMGSV